MSDDRDELAAVVIDMNLCARNDHPPDPDPEGECCACGMVVYQWPSGEGSQQ